MLNLARRTFVTSAQRLSSSTASFASHAGTSRRLSLTSALTFGTVMSVSAFYIGTTYPPSIMTILYPRPANGPPLDPDSPESRAEIARIEDSLNRLPIVVEYRAKTPAYQQQQQQQQQQQHDEGGWWYESRPYLKYPEEKRVNSLTAGALRGAGKLAVPPLVFARRIRKVGEDGSEEGESEKEGIVIAHVGRGLCGHDGIVHGGLIATLLDEALARTAMPNLPNKIAVTANLSVDYRAPTKADQFIIIKTKLESVKGRKAVVTGRIEDVEGTLLVESKAIFVEPKYAKLLNRKAIVQAMGEPTSPSPLTLANATTTTATATA